MEDYNKIIESLSIRFIKSNSFKILQPFKVDNFYDIDNTLILLHKGQITFGESADSIQPGEVLVIPGGQMTSIQYGQKGYNGMGQVKANENKLFYETYNPLKEKDITEDHYTYISFEAKVFDSVSFFSSLDIPPFAISNRPEIERLVSKLIRETHEHRVGRERVIRNFTDQLVVEVVRYILDNNLFVEQLATNSTYFKDPRLLNIFAYIKENINGDLSNKKLAEVASVSEDYVGQYFKMLTGINPQDYIEYQRMELAVNLLRTTKRSIREIGKEVGYKDTAYFCRRFKMMFGIPAGKMRRRESLMNV
jgi:AraC-like DNA-binding protein